MFIPFAVRNSAPGPSCGGSGSQGRTSENIPANPLYFFGKMFYNSAYWD